MEVDKNDVNTLYSALDEWEQCGMLTRAKTEELKKTIELRRNDRQQVAQYFLFMALFCTLLAFAAIFLNEKLLEKIKAWFSWSDAIITVITAVLSFLWLWYIGRKKKQLNESAYEIYMVLGGLSVLTSLVYLCKDLGLDKTYVPFLGMAFPVLAIISILLRTRALWIAAILAAVAWFGIYTSIYSQDNLFLGMNYAVRFAVFGIILLGGSWVQYYIKPFRFTQKITYISGLLLTFTGLWAVSIFGNYNTLAEWHVIRQIHVLAYSILFGIAAVLSFYLGIRFKDEAARDFGVMFLLINLYTRYFEYFWDGMNKGIFFLILAITFGFVGWFLEKKSKAPKKETAINKP